MSRKKRTSRKGLSPDARYNSMEVTRLTNMLLQDGKKSIAWDIVYRAMDIIGEETKEDPLTVLKQAFTNMRPRVEVRSRRVGGANYQVPQEVPSTRSLTLAIRWMLQVIRKRKGKPTHQKLAEELIAAYRGEGETIKRRNEVHRMAEANRVFAHYRW